jgi:hypothetical protein
MWTVVTCIWIGQSVLRVAINNKLLINIYMFLLKNDLRNIFLAIIAIACFYLP